MGEYDGHGGAGGITARYDDMLAVADRLDLSADVLREAGGEVRAVAFSPHLAEALVVAADKVAVVEGSLALATIAPGGADWEGVELEAFAKVVREGVELYRATDELLAELEEDLWTAAGFVAGPALLGSLLLNPLGTGITGYLLYENLDDHPWLLDALTTMAPGLLQGSALALLGPLAVLLGTDGRWPTGDYEDAIIGLQALAARFGLLRDDVPFAFDRGPEGHAYDLTGDRFIEQLLLLERDQAYRTVVLGDGTEVQVPRVHILPVQRDGQTAYVVQIPGTQVWDPVADPANRYDLTSNVTLMTQQERAIITEAVAQAMRDAGLSSAHPVMLMGHSQGGIIAAAIASDPALQREFGIDSVLTAGSPIGRFPIPDDVAVLAIEHAEDAVPKLDAADNPDRPNWTTIVRDLPDSAFDGQQSPIAEAHGLDDYAETGAGAQRPGTLPPDLQASVDQWLEDSAAFVPSAGVTDPALVFEVAPGHP
ncbi:PGAP1-like alpha/beta domain-containing protein [Nocardioides massiliensis]|uniref:GPI inositol-deacylase PGAP1-like alpha/beta domain-containing protein n=1 Tax=Nocardioides massiliensis TaxID=1325935 RepID=A0ABT9NMY3_9ACTN|nr:hypothetical protein [Nocardioides massiliensis]MDP9821564.1 hypothetical protein [Nocardioides massiliensis]